jgi:2-isopropylmalate synthase
VSAVQRNPETYEHIRPELVGNVQRILVSDLSGKSNILAKARQFGLDLDRDDPLVMEIVSRLKELEAQGFQFEGAEASFELLMRRASGTQRKYFDLLGFRVFDQKMKEDEPPQAEATVMVRVGGRIEHTAAVGNGPVNALDNAIRKALETFYPQLRDMSLVDYKVRVLPETPGTGAKVRVLIESKDERDKWGTVGVSHDIIEASWQALVDGICYKLLKSEGKNRGS